MQKLRRAEARLIEFSKKFGDRDPTADPYTMTTEETCIPAEVLPLKKNKKLKQDLYMHSIKITDKLKDSSKHDVPLVILPGYQNGALYFYRNVVSLSNYFKTVYSVDTLGCGLSSRTPGLLKKVDSSVDETEAFFVEALEAWRKANGISKMILAGHSMGGYIAVPYCEKYPQCVEQLLLFSPVGVTKEDEEGINDILGKMSWSKKAAVSCVRYLFDVGVTPASFSRKIPKSRSRAWVVSYVNRRLPVVTDPREKDAIVDYLHLMAVIPGFAEDMLNRFLRSSSHGVKPTIDRIPKLKIPKVSFIYGEYDWMDIKGAIKVYEQSRSSSSSGPEVEVYQLEGAGHLLMLDNWRGFHAAVVTMCGGTSTIPPEYPRPRLVRAAQSG